MTDTDLGAGPAQEQARDWLASWDAQQENHLPCREDRFSALIDAVAEGAGRPDPLVLDLGCGPGSLAVRLLDRLPQARVVAVDADPLLLALGRSAWRDRPGLRFAARDLRTPGWSRDLGLDRPADAAVSTTALHWLAPEELGRLYAELAGLLRPGGLLLDGDHLRADPAQTPVLNRLEQALEEQDNERNPVPPGTPDWASWWQAAAADPDLAGLHEQRQRLQLDTGHHGSPASLAATHVTALRAAGFTEVGALWQRGGNRLLCAVLGG
jgi:SAM-dependent methyltransferase